MREKQDLYDKINELLDWAKEGQREALERNETMLAIAYLDMRMALLKISEIELAEDVGVLF